MIAVKNGIGGSFLINPFKGYKMKIETKDILLIAALGVAGYFGWQYFKGKGTADQLSDSRFQQWLQTNPPPNQQTNPGGWQAWLDRALQLLQVLFPDGVKIGKSEFGSLLLSNPQLDSSGFGFGSYNYGGGFNPGSFNYNPFGGFGGYGFRF